GCVRRAAAGCAPARRCTRRTRTRRSRTAGPWCPGHTAVRRDGRSRPGSAGPATRAPHHLDADHAFGAQLEHCGHRKAVARAVVEDALTGEMLAEPGKRAQQGAVSPDVGVIRLVEVA